MRLKFWGTRGAFVAPGADFQKYGGATICTEILSSSGARALVDCGTGAIPLGQKLFMDSMSGGPKRFAILLSHTLIDHLMGLPFFPPVLMPGWDITVLGPSHAGRDISGILDTALNPDYSPLYGVENLGVGVRLRTITEGDFLWDGMRVRTRELPHGRTRSLGFRIEVDGAVIALIPGIAFEAVPPDAVLDLASDADILIHDSMGGSGRTSGLVAHPRPEDAVRTALEARARRLVLYHHDPDRNDGAIDAVVARLRAANPTLLIDAAIQNEELIAGESAPALPAT